MVIPTTYASLKDIKAGFGEEANEEDKVTFKKKDLMSLSQKLVVLSPTR
jgi:hypothetical protein